MVNKKTWWKAVKIIDMIVVDGARRWLVVWDGEDDEGNGWDASYEPTRNVSTDLDARGLAAVSGTGGPNALWHVQVASEFLMASSASYEAGHFDPGVAHSRPGNATRSQDAISTSRWTRRTLAKGGANFERLVLGRPSTDLDDSKRHPRLLFTINSHAALETLLTRA